MCGICAARPIRLHARPARKPAPTAPAEGFTRLEPSKAFSSLRVRELWVYREMLFFLVWRDIKVRYKQTVLGFAWAIIQPLFTMVVFTIFFGRMAGIKADNNVPYPIFSYTALLPWGLFTRAMSDAGRSLIANRNMITKIYFPRLIIPLSSVLGGVVDFLIQFGILILMMVYYGFPPTVNIWALPFLTALVPSERACRERGRRHKPLLDVGRQLALQARRWLPRRDLVVVGDSGFSALLFLDAMRRAHIKGALVGVEDPRDRRVGLGADLDHDLVLDQPERQGVERAGLDREHRAAVFLGKVL